MEYHFNVTGLGNICQSYYKEASVYRCGQTIHIEWSFTVYLFSVNFVFQDDDSWFLPAADRHAKW